MVSYLGSLVQFSPTMGRAGHCRQISLCVDSTHRVLATLGLPHTGVSVLSPSTLLRLLAALYGAGPALSAVPVFGYSTKARIWLLPAFCAFPGLSSSGSQRIGCTLPGCGAPFPSTASGPGSQRLGHTLPRCGAPFPSAAPPRAAGGVSGSL